MPETPPNPAPNPNPETPPQPGGLVQLVAMLTGQQVADETGAAAALKAFIDGLKQKITELEAKAESGSEGETAEVVAASLAELDPDVLEDLAESREMELDALVKDGRITPAVRDKLKPILVGESGKRPALALSTKAAKTIGAPSPFAKDIIAALRENDPVKLAEQTGPQNRTELRLSTEEAKEVSEGVDRIIKGANEGGGAHRIAV